MIAGPLNERIEVQQLSASGQVDSYGQDITTWTTLATVWGSVVGQPGTETLTGEQPTALAKYQIKIRYRSDLNTKMRLIWRGKTLQVMSIYDPQGKRDLLQLDCMERSIPG